ncbi:MAG: DJ-1/PfpI family protein [Treponema sp.]|jgi:4-methyl-5(b-hydroxyethyl)-thiazole monophosphate biosynthesis|nr:DJ-1/PfpI family protein [Treponema sp.]
MAKKALVLLADGFEEVEAVTPIDYLRRAGVEALTAAVGKSPVVKGAHGIPVTADVLLASLVKQKKLSPEAWDAVVLPGGMPGAANLAASGETGAFLQAMAAAGRLVCAICASPAVVLSPLGLLSGKKFTCYPGMEEKVTAKDSPGAAWKEEKVVIDGNIITSRGAGTAGAFAAAVIAKLVSEAESQKIAGSVLL